MTEAGERDYYSSNRPRHPLNVLMARVCFKPIMLYIEMHLVRTYFLCSVMTFSYYVMFIHNMFIFKKKAYRGFSLLYNCQHGRCLLVEDKRWSWQIRGRYLDVLHTMKSVISFPLKDKHVVNKYHVIRKSHDATPKKCHHGVQFNVARDWFETNSRHQKRYSEGGKKCWVSRSNKKSSTGALQTTYPRRKSKPTNNRWQSLHEACSQ